MRASDDANPKAGNQVTHDLQVGVLRDALKSLAKFISLGFGGSIGIYFLLRQWFDNEWTVIVISIGIFLSYTLLAAASIGLKKAAIERKNSLSIEKELESLQARKDEVERELKRSGLYVQNEVKVINELHTDGTWTSDSLIEIEVVGNGELGIISHWNKEALNHNSSFIRYEAEASVLKIPQGHNWRSEIIRKNPTKDRHGHPNFVEIVFYIGPPLKKEDIVQYKYTQKYEGMVCLSSDELKEVVESRRFLRDLLKEVRLYSILCPTKRFLRSILFHDSSLVSNIQVVALFRDAIDEGETIRAREHFSVTAQANNQTLACLDIPHPKTNFMYGIMWSLTK